MSSGTSAPDRGGQWARQWAGAGSALAAQRRRELASLSAEQALAAAEALLALSALAPLPEGRWRTSGLIEQQSLLHRRPAA